MASTATKRARKPDSLADKVRKHLRALEAGKKNYKRADALMDELEKEMVPGDSVALNEAGKRGVLKDKFADRNRINVGLNARRYEIEVTES